MPAERIVVVPSGHADIAIARDMAPSGFDLTVAAARSKELTDAMPDLAYLVGATGLTLNEAFYRAAPKLKLVQLLSAGYDTVDIEAARRAGVPVANNGGANSVAVAEHTLLLMLAVSRRLIWQHGNVAAGRWRTNDWDEKHLYELEGRVLGIVGLGTIGKKVARMAAAFGMTVQYYDIIRLNEDAEDSLRARFRLLAEILRTSDIVSLHVPLNEGTRGMIGAAELALMKPSAILVNTCRGPVVDETALHDALAGGRLWGAGLDVFEQEPPPPDNRLF
ncbi:MAG: 3-phosphoglycerate dehydrogenase, partial [Acetobacteraceae bacterium]|nr:3-phosphoglycerate dehydrogenase [Acetobacteraceae bacterium]